MLQGPGSVVKVQETPGVGLYYSEFIYGVPPVMVEHMASFPVVHQINIFVTNRFCPCPRVLKHESLLIEQLGIRGFYHCICRSALSFHQMAAHSHPWAGQGQHVAFTRARHAQTAALAAAS